MTSVGYQAWVTAGKPDSGLARPLADLRDLLRGDGYVVFDEPDARHLMADPPEDHTQFSATGWPGSSPRWWRHAIDIMPTKGGEDLYNLGQRIVADRKAGGPQWIKYLNVPTNHTLTGAVHHSWEPEWRVRSSSDTGHIHISSVTGVETTLTPRYDPFEGIVVVSHPLPNGLVVDGQLGPLTIRRWQHIMGTTEDGVITQPPGHSQLVKAVQTRLNALEHAGLIIDGQGIEQGGPWSYTAHMLQLYLGTQPDGIISAPVSNVIKAVQGRLNLGWF